MIQERVKNWRTTVWGICLVVVAIGQVAIAILDGDSATNPNWEAVTIAVTTAFGLLFSADGKNVK